MSKIYNNIYFGETSIGKVFKGDELVWIKSPSGVLIDEINPVEKYVVIITEEFKSEMIEFNMYEELQDMAHLVVVNTNDKIKVISTTEGVFEAQLEDMRMGVLNSIGKDVKEVEFDMLNPKQGVVITNNDLGTIDLGLKIYKVN